MGKNCADRRGGVEWDSFIATQALYYANHNYEGGEIRRETKRHWQMRNVILSDINMPHKSHYRGIGTAACTWTPGNLGCVSLLSFLCRNPSTSPTSLVLFPLPFTSLACPRPRPVTATSSQVIAYERWSSSPLALLELSCKLPFPPRWRRQTYRH